MVCIFKLKNNIIILISKFKVSVTLKLPVLALAYNVGSYTQGRIAGDLAIADFQFLSNRKAARAERCPPKTTAAALAGS